MIQGKGLESWLLAHTNAQNIPVFSVATSGEIDPGCSVVISGGIHPGVIVIARRRAEKPCTLAHVYAK